jgi:ribosome-associated protein
MLRLSMKNRKSRVISMIEAENTCQLSFTLNTLQKLSREYPEDRLILLIGSDSLRQLHTWHNAREIVEKWEIAAYPRPREIARAEDLIPFWGARTTEKLLSTIKDLPGFDISSTEIRQRIIKGISVKGLINPSVKCYIDENHLYKNISEKNRRHLMSEKKRIKEAEELAALCVKTADERKAEDVIQLQVTKYSTIADFFVLCTANSEPHLKAVSERVKREARKELGIRPLASEGLPSSQWILVDFGAVIVHVMTRETRELYQLESLWGDADKKEAVELLEKIRGKNEK